MTVRTKGDMCGLTIREEKVYGEVDTAGTSEYAGTLQTMTTSDDETTEAQIKCGSIVTEEPYTVSTSTGFSATFNHKRGQKWERWIELANGGLDGAKSTSPSFDAEFRVAADEFHLLTGCRVDSLSIAGQGIGQALLFSVTAVSRWHTMTPFADSDGSPLTMDPAAIPSGAPLTFNFPWEYSTDGSRFDRIPAKSFALLIARSLQSEPGLSKEGGYQLEAGGDSVAQDSEIKLELTVTSSGPEWDRLRLALQKGMTFKAVIDGKTVTLSGCSIAPAGPQRTQGTYDETISVTATDMVVA